MPILFAKIFLARNPKSCREDGKPLCDRPQEKQKSGLYRAPEGLDSSSCKRRMPPTEQIEARHASSNGDRFR